MPRYINADALLEQDPEVCADYGPEYGVEFGYSRDQIANAPTVSPDEVQGVVRGVVHCRNCYHAELRDPVGEKTKIFCRLFIAGMREDDFCSHGKFLTNCGAKMKGADA